MNGRPGHPIPRRRWGIAVLLGVSVLFNYFDRLALSVAGPSLRQELHLDALTLGVLFSAFSWSYAALQIPSGMILDRFGVTRVGRIGIMCGESPRRSPRYRVAMAVSCSPACSWARPRRRAFR